jgi:prepilin peptidase CpaA
VVTPVRFQPSDIGLLAVLSISAATDLRVGRIFNVVTYPAIAFGLAGAALGIGPDLLSSLLGCLVGGLSFYLLFAFGWMGGGDVKLMAAVGALRGFPFVLHAMFYSVFFGGVAAGLMLVWRGETRAVLGDLLAVVRRLMGIGPPLRTIPPRGGRFPFGLAICLGTLTALFLDWGGWGLS